MNAVHCSDRYFLGKIKSQYIQHFSSDIYLLRTIAVNTQLIKWKFCMTTHCRLWNKSSPIHVLSLNFQNVVILWSCYKIIKQKGLIKLLLRIINLCFHHSCNRMTMKRDEVKGRIKTYNLCMRRGKLK